MFWGILTNQILDVSVGLCGSLSVVSVGVLCGSPQVVSAGGLVAGARQMND